MPGTPHPGRQTTDHLSVVRRPSSPHTPLSYSPLPPCSPAPLLPINSHKTAVFC
ncbi:MAG: hypothetical protein R3C62_08690 [Chloroflexota bacterium]